MAAFLEDGRKAGRYEALAVRSRHEDGGKFFVGVAQAVENAPDIGQAEFDPVGLQLEDPLQSVLVTYRSSNGFFSFGRFTFLSGTRHIVDLTP